MITWLFVLSGAALLLLFILCCIIYRIVFYSGRKRQLSNYKIPGGSQYDPYRPVMEGLIGDLEKRPFEEVCIVSFDGLKLYGRYYHARDKAPLDIAFHGYRGTAVRDMCGGIRISYQTGHNILLVDERAHGKSEGRTITFGIRERYDCLSWVNYARERFGSEVRILLYGVSMGAATVLMASELVPAENVCGILADSPYSSPGEIIRKVCRDRKLPVPLIYPLIALSARWFGGFRLSGADAAEAVRHSAIPVLILHGEEDLFVPCEMSRIIAAARPDIQRYTFPATGHGMSDIVHTRRYEELVLCFIERYCPDGL